jgi:hypothetical protein
MHFGGGGHGGMHFGGGHGGGIHVGGIRPGGVHFGSVRAGSMHGFASHGVARHDFGHVGGHVGTRSFAGHNFSHGNLNHGNFPNHGNFAAHNALVGHNAVNAHNNAPGDHAFSGNHLTHNQLTHNQFAAEHFRGLHDFNYRGFNRNSFGNDSAWNRWGGNFYGAGWNDWGGGWGGWAGPVFWPFLLGDIFSFAFWPYGYYNPFWAYGPAFFLGSVFAPGPYFGQSYGYGPDYYGSVGSNNFYYGSANTANLDESDRVSLAETNNEAVQSCGGLAPGVTDLPIDRIQQTLRPTGNQVAALNDLNTASSKAGDVVAASCPKEVPLTPIGRLDAAEQRLDATIKAVAIVHSPLEHFYESLSDEQRTRFNAMGRSSQAGGSDLASLCGQQSGSASNLPIQRIEQVIEPNGQQQQEAFNALKQASLDASKELQTSCPTQMPQTPVARLVAVDARLKAMVEAMKIVRPKLRQFYGTLSDEQKARFNTMGPPRTASAQTQQNSAQ